MSDFALSAEAREWIYKNIPEGSIICEYGSGAGSAILAERYKMYCVENDLEWVGKYSKINYIYSKLKQHKAVKGFDADVWYTPSDLEHLKELDVSLFIIDGPKGGHGYGQSGRQGALKYFDLFKPGVPLLLDDVHRGAEKKLAIKLSARMKTPVTFHATWTDKHFAIIQPEKSI